MVLHVVEPLLPPGGLAPPQADRAAHAEVKAFAEYVDRHLLVAESDPRDFTIRQRERVFHLGDDDIGQAFALVPEAQSLALQAQKTLRIARTLSGIGTGAGLSFLLVPVLLTVPPAVVAALVLSGLGLATMFLAIPFHALAKAQFTSAINVYNRALLDPSRREQVEVPPEPAPDDAGRRSVEPATSLHFEGAATRSEVEADVSVMAAAPSSR